MKFRNIKLYALKTWLSFFLEISTLAKAVLSKVATAWRVKQEKKSLCGKLSIQDGYFLDLFQQLVNILWFSSRIKRPRASMPRVVLQISFTHALFLNGFEGCSISGLQLFISWKGFLGYGAESAVMHHAFKMMSLKKSSLTTLPTDPE